MGRDYWYGFSMYMPIDFPDHGHLWTIGQWHAMHKGGAGSAKRSPVLFQQYKSGKFYVNVGHSSEKIEKANDITKIAIYQTRKFEKGVWHDFIYHVKWSYENDGFVEMWQNGKKRIDYKGPIGTNDDEGPYFKYGIYRRDVPETYVMYFDEYRRGNSYEEVDPAGNDPVD